MKKEALLRGLLGVPLGIALGHIISLLASLGLAGGEFSPCVPSLVQPFRPGCPACWGRPLGRGRWSGPWTTGAWSSRRGCIS